MAKCSKCGKEIKNTYWLNGKVYGYNCYKQELAMILAEKEKLANEKYQLDVAVTVEVLKNRTKLNDFLKSIINFYEEKGFLSFKQVECIKLTASEKFEKWLTVHEISKNEERKEEIQELIFNKIYENMHEKDINMEDERLINLLKEHRKIKRRIAKGKNVSLYKYIRDGKIITTLELNSLEDIKTELEEDELKFVSGFKLN